ncbi:MAG: hypothetical protein H7A38_00755 [Chlamydiales bacterium]|nr:hypothetical protein [Chlamydiales bacterium]
MEEITEKRCIELMKETFPKFLPYWESYIKKHGSDDGITIQMLPFCEYTIEVIKSNNEIEIKKIFDFVEFLLCNGNDFVQTGITTSYLEYLMSQDPDEIQFASFVKYLGKNSIEYCRAWDKFTGVKTKGLWEDS